MPFQRTDNNLLNYFTVSTNFTFLFFPANCLLWMQSLFKVIIFLQLKQDWNMMAQNLLKSYIFLRDRYTHICSLYSCNINSKCWIDFSGLLWSNKLNQQWLVNRVRISRATLPNLFHKTLLASLTLHWIEGLRRVKPSFQLQQRDFTSTFARRIWKWIPLQWYRLHL